LVSSIVLLLVSSVSVGWRSTLLDVGVREHSLLACPGISAMPPVCIQLVVDSDLITNFKITVFPLGIGVTVECCGSGYFWLGRFSCLAAW
jgi:hypothetical protein